MKKKSKDSKKGCLFLIIGTLAVLVGMALYIFLTGRLSAAVIGSRYEGQAVYAIMTIQIPGIIVAFIMMDAVLILQYLPSEEEVDRRRQAPMLGQKQQAHSFLGSKKAANILSALLLLGVVVCSVVSANTYQLMTEDGIETYFFARTSAYEWKQVSAYRVDCDSDKGLSVTYTMRDGKTFEITQGTLSTTVTFDEKYGSTDDSKAAVMSFAVAMDEKMEALQIPCNVTHMEKAVAFYRDAYPSLWTSVSRLIRYEDVFLDDETAPVTQAPETAPESADVQTEAGTAQP